jgi:hypothetical protein
MPFKRKQDAYAGKFKQDTRYTTFAMPAKVGIQHTFSGFPLARE